MPIIKSWHAVARTAACARASLSSTIRSLSAPTWDVPLPSDSCAPTPSSSRPGPAQDFSQGAHKAHVFITIITLLSRYHHQPQRFFHHHTKQSPSHQAIAAPHAHTMPPHVKRSICPWTTHCHRQHHHHTKGQLPHMHTHTHTQRSKRPPFRLRPHTALQPSTTSHTSAPCPHHLQPASAGHPSTSGRWPPC